MAAEEPPNLEATLKALGMSASGIDRIKFGNGVVGKMATLQMVLYVVCFSAIVAGGFYEQLVANRCGARNWHLQFSIQFPR